MFVSADTLALMTELGIQGEDLVRLFKALEADARAIEPVRSESDDAYERRKEKDRERKRARKFRGNSAESSAESSAETSLSLPPSPTPPSTNPNPVTPLNPPTARVTDELVDRIYLLQPKAHRRSSRPDIRKSLVAAARRGADPDEVFAALSAYYGSPDAKAEGGQFAKGAHRLIEHDRWRDHLPSLEPPEAVSPEVLAWRLERFDQLGEWRADWGERPPTAAA